MTFLMVNERDSSSTFNHKRPHFLTIYTSINSNNSKVFIGLRSSKNYRDHFKQRNVTSSKLKMDSRCCKILLLFYQFLWTVSAPEQDCHHIFFAMLLVAKMAILESQNWVQMSFSNAEFNGHIFL